MANWCCNTIAFEDVYARRKVMTLLARADDGFSFEEVVPMPEGEVDVRGWRKEHWGTSWDISDVEIEDRFVSFETAWAAPVPIYEELVRAFPDVKMDITWEEDGAAIAGRLIADGDGTIRLAEGEYDCDDDDDDVWRRGWQQFLRDTFEAAEKAEQVKIEE